MATKADLINHLKNLHSDLTKTQLSDLVDDVFGLTVDLTNEDGPLTLRGIGTFRVTQRKARKGRNPQTGEELTIPAKRVLTFKQSSVLAL